MSTRLLLTRKEEETRATMEHFTFPEAFLVTPLANQPRQGTFNTQKEQDALP